jgi:hypothetical protein
MLRRASFAISLVLLLVLNGRSVLHGRPPRPRVTLWAWERPELFKVVHSPNVGVAYLAAGDTMKASRSAISSGWPQRAISTFFGNSCIACSTLML